jgi:hypothetical protein
VAIFAEQHRQKLRVMQKTSKSSKPAKLDSSSRTAITDNLESSRILRTLQYTDSNTTPGKLSRLVSLA